MTGGQPPAIEVRGLRRSYGAAVAVDGLDLTVEAGEIFGFLGPNGAGKTTTIEILEGYKRADAGTARVLGLDPARQATQLRAQIGVMLQETALYPQITVSEALTLFAGYYPRPAAPEAVLATIGLVAQRASQVKTLSGGQRRRLELGLALIGNPRLLFLDEPTVGFDPQARRGAWDVIRRQRERGVTVFLTTQSLDEAEALCDRVAIVERGKVIALDTPGALRQAGAREARITFHCAVPLDLDRVRALDGVSVIESESESRDELYTVLVEDPTAALHELTGQALARGGTLRQLTVTGVSLEDVFLRLTSVAPAATVDEEARR